MSHSYKLNIQILKFRDVMRQQLLLQFVSEYNSEKTIKIGPHLPKLSQSDCVGVLISIAFSVRVNLTGSVKLRKDPQSTEKTAVDIMHHTHHTFDSV